MSWYNTTGPCQNYVLFSKVRYTRNIAKNNFYHLCDQKKADDLLKKLDPILQNNGFRGEKTASGLSPSIIAYAEKQFAEPGFVYSDKQRFLYLNEPCNLIIAVGGENYITISSVVSGLSLMEAKNMASEAEEFIDRDIPFAYSEAIGYLSSSPAECGSCAEYSACLYLPSQRLSRSYDLLNELPSTRGLSIRPMFADRENAGDLFILSYVPHYLCNEDAALTFFSDIVSSVIEHEKTKLSMILNDSYDLIYNSARRSLGTLLYSECISEPDMLSYISNIRLSLCISPEKGCLPSLTDLNYLCAEGLNCSVIAASKTACSSQKDCDALRAKMISRYIEHKNEEI